MERAWMLPEIQRSRTSHEGFMAFHHPMGFTGSSGSSSSGAWDWPPDWDALTERPRLAIGETMWRSSWSYSEELNGLKTAQCVLEAVRTMHTNRTQFYKVDYDAMCLRLSSLGSTNAGGVVFRALRIPNYIDGFEDQSLIKELRKTLRIEAGRRVVMTAIALKRFQLRHGKWPGTLGELAPEFLASVPIDPDDGKPLKYHPNADGAFLLYSVGEDGVDNGGDSTTTTSGGPSLFWLYAKARDWVWPQPASPAELRNFFEHPPK
jgi:hypothetical protein